MNSLDYVTLSNEEKYNELLNEVLFEMEIADDLANDIRMGTKESIPYIVAEKRLPYVEKSLDRKLKLLEILKDRV